MAPWSSDQLAESRHLIKLLPTKLPGKCNRGMGVGQEVKNKRNFSIGFTRDKKPEVAFNLLLNSQ